MSRESTWAIVPVKSLAEAKQRLASMLPLEARRRLMLAMLQDVLSALREVETLAPLLVVTPDARVAEVAESNGAAVVREERSRGHSAAAAAGFAHARARGAVQALTLPADVPLVTPDELRRVLETANSPSPRASPTAPRAPSARGEGRGEGQPQPPALVFAAAPHPNPLPTEVWGEGTRAELRAKAHITLVPSRDGDGTNALLVSPPHAFEPTFGPGSFVRHLAQAEARQVQCRVLRLAGLGLDIDEPRDLLWLMQVKQGDPRYEFLREHCGRLFANAGSGAGLR